MIWILFSILTALFTSLHSIFGKLGVHKTDEYISAWSVRLFALPLLLPFLFIIEIPTLSTKFWQTLIIVSIINLITWIIFMKALKASDISLLLPLSTFTPMFIFITSPLLISESPPILGILGIITIVIGAYILNIKQKQKRISDPFKTMFKEKGPRLMLLAAFLWSITATMDKVGVTESSPIFWAISVNLLISILMTPIILIKSKSYLSQIKEHSKFLFPIGFFHGISIIFQMAAISLTFVAYVIAIKRTSVIISALFGYFIFKEENIKERMIGSIIMVIGVLLITLA